MSQTGRAAAAATATRACFASLGVLAGAWGAHVPSLRAAYDLGPQALSLCMLAASAGSVAMLAVAGRLVARLGARGASRLGGVLAAGALAAVLALPGAWAVAPVMFVMGAGESLLDIAMNAEGAVLEQLAGRPLMSGFHAMFSVGAMAGAGASAALLRWEVAPAWQLAGVGAALGMAVVVGASGMLDAHPDDGADRRHFAWPRGPLLAIGGLIAVGLLAEGAMYNWSVLYVRRSLGTPGDLAALAYVSLAGSMAAMRFAGDRLRGRWPDRTLLVAGGLASAVALAAVLSAARPWVALAGFGVVGAGLGIVVPILYTAATRVPGTTPAAAIAAVSGLGMGGLMAGPPLIGAVAERTSLATALWVVVAACGTLALGARAATARR